MKRLVARGWSLAAIVLVTTAHVGSPDTWFEGKAGPYTVRVLIRSPQVIPARAEIVVRVLGCDSGPRGDLSRGRPQGPPLHRPCAVREVTATPRLWNSGAQGAPPPDIAAPVPGDSSLYSLMLWIMRQGSYAVLVHVDGAAGSGTAVVPYTAVATAVLGMNRGFGLGLIAFGLFLVVGLVTLVGAATREATLEPGLVPDIPQRRRSLRARVIAVVVIVLILTGGRVWWNAENRAYAAAIFRPVPATAAVIDSAGGRIFRLTIAPPARNDRSWAPLVPDHGKLMHLFLVKADDLGAIAHLHPVQRDTFEFNASLPPLPAGRYRVYADVVHESGFAATIVESLTVTGGDVDKWAPSDDDDAVYAGGASASAGDSTTVTMTGGSHPVAGQDAGLAFSIRDRSGAPASVEPYLGMAGHAVVVRKDGGVYVHLHPAGTASAGAQQALLAWTPADSVRGSISARLGAHSMATMTHEAMPGELHFPYAFPSAGDYRVWVQFRRGGSVRTVAFDVTVSDR